jgi:hypothetical protein
MKQLLPITGYCALSINYMKTLGDDDTGLHTVAILCSRPAPGASPVGDIFTTLSLSTPTAKVPSMATPPDTCS